LRRARARRQVCPKVADAVEKLVGFDQKRDLETKP
jgi:hypothetical protein